MHYFRSSRPSPPKTMFKLLVGVPVSTAMSHSFPSADLEEIDLNNRQVLGVTAFFDLLDRIGQKLEQIGKLHVSQKIEVLRRAEAGGCIRRYTLKYGQKTIASIDWNDCADEFSLSVGLVEPDPEASPDILSQKTLRQFVKELRVDLKELGKLGRPQLVDMSTRLKVLEIVDDLEVEEQLAIKDNSSGNYSSDLMQCVLPSPSIPFLPTSDFTPFQETDLDFGQWINYSPCIAQGNSSPPVPDTSGPSFPVPVATPLEHVNTPLGLENGASSYPAPSTSYLTSPPTASPLALPGPMNCPQQIGVETLIDPNFGMDVCPGKYIDVCGSSHQVPNAISTTYASSATTPIESLTPLPSGTGFPSYPTPTTYMTSPPAGRQLNLPASSVYQVANTPESTCVPFTVPAATPMESVSPLGLCAGALSYPTPPANHVDSPRMFEPLTLSGSGVSTAQQANTPIQNHDPQKQQQTIFELLQSCRFGDKAESLNNEQIQKNFKLGAHLLARDPFMILQPLLEDGTNVSSSSLKRLGLPEKWKGIEGAVNYLRVLDKDKDKKVVLKPLARRVAQVLLYLNYEDLCKQGETNVVESILVEYRDDPNKPMTKIFRHNNFSTYHVRRGRWWWRLAVSLGFGILCVADNALMNTMCSDRFTNAQIDVFITFVLHTRPGTVRLFHLLQPIAASLISGSLPKDLSQILFDDNTGFLSQKALAHAHKKDQEAFWSQKSENPWMVEYTKDSTGEAAVEFMNSLFVT